MKKINCKYIDNDGFCHHPNICCVQECAILLIDKCCLK